MISSAFFIKTEIIQPCKVFYNLKAYQNKHLYAKSVSYFKLKYSNKH